MNDTIQQIIIAVKKQRKEKFPDHICAQSNSIMCHAGSICENAHLMKYSDKDLQLSYIKQSLINTAAACIRMIEELEKK